MALGERSKVSLTFGAYTQTSVSFCLTFLASIMISALQVQKNEHEDLSNINALEIKFRLAVKRSKSTQIHHLCKFGRAHISKLHAKSKGHWPWGSREEDI